MYEFYMLFVCFSLLLALDAGGRYLNAAAAANAGVLQSHAAVAGLANQQANHSAAAAAAAAMMTVSR